MDNLDIYGLKPVFYFDRKEKVRTSIGMLVSFLLACLVACSLWFFAKDMLYKETPTLLTSSFNVEDPPPFSLTKDNFYLAVGINDTFGAAFMDETYYTILPRLELISFDKNGDLKIEYKEVALKPCSEVNFPLLKESYSKLSINNLYCIDQDEMVIEGDFGQEVFTTLRVECNKCVGRPECKSNEEIVEKMKNGYFSAFVVDYSLDPTNYSEPLQSFMHNVFTILDPTVYKELTTYLSMKAIISDTGIIFEDRSTISGYSIQKTVELQSNTPIDTILTFFVRVSKTSYKYQRIYLKVQKVAANMGGMIKILVVLGRLLTYLFTNTFYFETVSQWIFPAERSKRTVPDLSKSSLSVNNFVKPESIKAFKKAIPRKKVTLTGIASYMVTGRNKQASVLFELKRKYGEYVKSRFDLKTLVKYQNELILLKKMLLSPEQNRLITFFESFQNYSKVEEEAYTQNNKIENASADVRRQLEESISACRASGTDRDKIMLSVLGLN